VVKLQSRSTITPHRAEAKSLLTATETISQLETRPKKVVLLTNSLSVLQSLASGNPEEVYTAELQ